MTTNPTPIGVDSPEARLMFALDDMPRYMGLGGETLADALRAMAEMIVEQGRLLGRVPTPEAADPRLLLDIAEVAERLGIAESSVARAVSRGEIPVVHVGKRRKVRSADLRRYVDFLAVDNQRPAPPPLARPRRGQQSRRT